MPADVIMRPPRTMLEVYQSLPEGTPVQLIKNKLIMAPSPNELHQKIAARLVYQLIGYVENHHLGEVRFAPYDVYLDKRNVYQPDIIFIAKENADRIREDGLHGAPDLVIEILSPATARYDLKDKKEIYERNGVKEYWIIDPATESAEGFYLTKGEFVPLIKTEKRIKSRLLKTDISF